MSRHSWVRLGHISGVYGVRGWVKVFSDTYPREQILHYQPWHLAAAGETPPGGEGNVVSASGRVHGKGVIAKLADVDDRDAAAELIGCEIYVPREMLPEAEPGHYYWSDLLGLDVRNTAGERLGKVFFLCLAFLRWGRFSVCHRYQAIGQQAVASNQ